MSKRLYVRNFEQYQHYTKRRPPWVKLYRQLLDDRALMQLPPEARYVAIGLILIASENDQNAIENDERWLGERLHMEPRRVRESVKSLLRCRFLASTTLAGRKQDAPLEVEREKEKEKPLAVDLPVASNGARVPDIRLLGS